jgi:hypothetical protein|tara:strand:+ start:1593 stop:2234 length:642 start_codon:yes stop_codon:yes gene_type:complete
MYQQLAKLGSKIAATQLGKKALAEGGKELLKSSIPGAVITTGLSTLTTGNPLAGLLIGATDLGASFGLSRALAGRTGNVLGMPLSGKYSYRVKDGLKTAKGTPRKQVNIADQSMVDRVYEQSMPQTIAQLAGSVGAVVALEPQFMPQAYNESQAVTQQQQLAQMKYLNNMNMPDTADGTLYQTQGIPDRKAQEEKRNREIMMMSMMMPGMGVI